MARPTKATPAKAKATSVKTVAAEEKTAKTVAAKAAVPEAEEKKTEKKAPAKATTAKTAAKPVEKTVEKTVEKAPVAEKKAAPAKETTAASVAEFYVEYGNAQVSVEKVIEDVKKTYAAEGNTDEIKSVKVYLKPEEQVAYYVVNDTVNGKIDVYFY